MLFVIDAVADPAADAYREERAQLPREVPVTLVFNKCDLAAGRPPGDNASEPPSVRLSALTGAGVDELRTHLQVCMGYQSVEGGTISARARHLEALGRARRHTDEAAKLLNERRAGELAAEELRLVQQALGEITGEFSSEDLLGRIFAGFCIGK